MFRDITCPQCGLCIKECILQNDAIKATSTGVEIDLSLCISCGHTVLPFVPQIVRTIPWLRGKI